MYAQKEAYETKHTTLARLEVIWRKSIHPFWGLMYANQVNQDKVTEFIAWHKANRPRVQLVNVFKYLGNIFSVMTESGALPQGKKPKLELPREEQKHHAKQKGRYITDSEFQKILKGNEPWFKLYLLMSYCTGMRKMEIGELEVLRLHYTTGRYIVKLNTDDTKTGRAREIPLPEFMTPLINKQKSKSEYLFHRPSDPSYHIPAQTIDLAWRKAKRRAKIEGRMRYHDIRHTAASNMAKANINPSVAVTTLGMNLGTFQKTYLKLTAQDLVIATESAVSRLGM